VIELSQFMTVDEVADLCRTTPETVRYWRYAGSGPRSFKVGRRVLFAVEDVEKWLESARGLNSGKPAA
jgi:excisionase family DNA binding protein